MNFVYRIYPDATQEQLMLDWLETCRKVYNQSLRELKDWLASRKCFIDRCSLNREYIIPADVPFPSYQRQQDQLPQAKKENPELATLHSQVLQTTVRRLHDTWEAFQKRGFGFPRFKKYGQFRSFVYPQFKSNPVTDFSIKLPKSSKNWEKAQLKVARLHHHIGNTRKNFHFQTAHSLCDSAQTIFAEDLNTVGLNRGMLRKECVDASFGAFLSLLEWVCWKRGCYFERVNPRGTSQTCPECGATVAKPLSEREHICPECGYRTHRDHAAAQVVLNRGIENVVPQDLGEWKLPSNGVLSGVSYLDKCRSRNASS